MRLRKMIRGQTRYSHNLASGKNFGMSLEKDDSRKEEEFPLFRNLLAKASTTPLELLRLHSAPTAVHVL